MNFIQGIKNLAASISKAGWGKNANLTDAFSVLGDSAGWGAAAARKDLQSAAKNIINNINLEGASQAEREALTKHFNNITKDGLSHSQMMSGFNALKGSIEGMSENTLNISQDAFDSMVQDFGSKISMYGKAAQSGDFAQYFGREAGSGIGLKNMAKGYFFDPMDNLGKVRRRTTEAVVGGGLVAGRYTSGGDLTTNSRGERDIVGVPFI